MEFGVSVLLRPQVKRNGGEFVDEGVGKAVLGEVNGLHVGLASVAALDADVREFFGGVDRKLGVVFLAASGADDTSEFPFREADPSQQAAAATVALLAEDAERGFAVAERAEGMGITLKQQRSAGADEFGVRLKKSEHEEFLGIGGRVDVGPAFGEQVSPGIGV